MSNEQPRKPKKKDVHIADLVARFDNQDHMEEENERMERFRKLEKKPSKASKETKTQEEYLDDLGRGLEKTKKISANANEAIRDIHMAFKKMKFEDETEDNAPIIDPDDLEKASIEIKEKNTKARELFDDFKKPINFTQIDKAMRFEGSRNAKFIGNRATPPAAEPVETVVDEWEEKRLGMLLHLSDYIKREEEYISRAQGLIDSDKVIGTSVTKLEEAIRDSKNGIVSSARLAEITEMDASEYKSWLGEDNSPKDPEPVIEQAPAAEPAPAEPPPLPDPALVEPPPLPPPLPKPKPQKSPKKPVEPPPLPVFDEYANPNPKPQPKKVKNEYFDPYTDVLNPQWKVGGDWEKKGEAAEAIHKAAADLRKNGVEEDKVKAIEKREEEKMWVQEKEEAQKMLDDARARFVAEHQAGEKAHKERPRLEKLKDMLKLTGLRRSLGFKVKEKEPTNEFKSARKEYDIAKKRFQNAESNLIRGREEGKPEKEIQAQIAKELLLNVSAREYSELAKARVENLTPTEKGSVRKLLDRYRRMSPGTKVILTSTLITGVTLVGFGPAVAAGVFTASVGRKFLALGLSTATTAATKVWLGNKNEKARIEKLTQAEESYSPIGDINTYDTIENEAETKRFKAALLSAGAGAAVALLITLTVRAEGLDDALSKSVTDKFIPDEKIPGDVMPKARIDMRLERDNTSDTGAKPVFTNEIKDFKVHGKVVSDSAELSLRKTLEGNAEKFGWKPESGMTASKWSEIEMDKFAKTEEGAMIRYAQTHDGNRIVAEVKPEGGFTARVEAGEGKMYTFDKKFEKLFAEKKTFGPDVPAVKSVAWNELNKIPKAKLLDTKFSVPEIIREYALRGKATPTQVRAFRDLVINKKIV